MQTGIFYEITDNSGRSIWKAVEGNAMGQKVLAAMSDSEQLEPMIVLGKRRYYKGFWRQVFSKRTEIYMEAFNLFGDPTLRLSGIPNYANLVLAAGDNIPNEGKVTYTATNTIENEGGFVLQSGSKVDLLAGEKIHLKQGFHGKRGAFFTAKTGDIPARLTGITSRSLVLSDEDLEAYLNILSDENETIIENHFAYCVFPNPVNSDFSVSYTINSDSFVKFELYNISGEKVQTLFDLNDQPAGNHYCNFSIADLAPGIYILIFSSSTKTINSKIIKK